ncbi:MAG: N-acetylmuramoyl-L-alanine amidase [Terriglobales bacterium]
MKNKFAGRHGRLSLAAAPVAVLLLLLPAYGRSYKSDAWARSQFAVAQRLHQSLEARPAEHLTRADYERVINAYRLVYFEAPASTRADPSVVAVGQLKEEMGRRFEDDDILRSAIAQYEFLRRQYPGSKARFGALFRIGEIYKDDLHDKSRADAVFQEFLQHYPRNQFAEQARRALAEPVENASLKTPLKKPTELEPKDADDGENDQAAPRDNDDNDKDASSARPETAKPVHVLGIRHWSAPGYSRIAVDLDGDVKFESQRIGEPDRIFFDLLNTRLNPDLLAKTFDVDDSFVKKIRISQFRPGRTRVVLEVNDVAGFAASLKADPPRLVIDVGNKDTRDHARHEDEDSGTAATHKEHLDSARTDDAARAEAAVEKNSTSAELEADPVNPCRSGGSDPEDCRSDDQEKPRRKTVVVTASGIKKTIVDADADETPAPKNVAKLDLPEMKPPRKSRPNGPAEATKKKDKQQAPADDIVAREAQPTASGARSLTRALDLKIGKIVIDPGHGGHDTGTIGPRGLEEKDLVLDVSLRLGKLLTRRLGAEVVYTRTDDTFIPLETRTAIANREGADLFISVHANSSRDPDARGVETYYLNFTSSPDALEVAARENAVSEKSIHELQDLVKKIALKEKIEESQEFASDVESSLYSGLAAKSPGLRNRGVKQAPFIVLIGANMPSVLAEISFVSNPGDERRLRTSEYRQRIAESLYRGIAKYVSGLSGVKVASKIDKGEGQ